jgi:hypothetical protein
MHQDEELHAELMRLFRLYFEQNQKWLNEGTKRAGMDTRALLSEIRRVCTKRRISIMEWRRWKNQDMAEKKAQKRIQKGSGKE